MNVQQDMFGEPARDPAKSQWFTPPWLALKLASWVHVHDLVCEPSAGKGELIRGLLHAGHPRDRITAVEIDGRYFEALSDVVEAQRLYCPADFFALRHTGEHCDVVLMNPPFEGNLHMRFVLRALEIAPVVVGIFPASFEYGVERDRELWATKAVVTNRARLPERVDYGGDQSPSFDSVALRITRRSKPREPGERLAVYEEVWRP